MTPSPAGRTEIEPFARRAAPWLTVLAFSVAFRLPSLLNAAHTTSDAAIVGIQAMQILRGEWSAFLLGSGYQTSVDSFVAAVWFLVLGPTALALRLSTFVGHVVATWLAFATLRRHLPPWRAALLVVPLVFTTAPLHTYILYPPRQASLTLVFASVFLLDAAGSSRRPLARYAAGMATATLAAFADPYAMLFLPGLALLAVLSCLDGSPGRAPAVRRLAATGAGGLAGLAPLWLLSHSARASHGQTSIRLDVWRHNLELLFDPCLPWLLGTKVQYAKHMLEYEPWAPPAPFRLVQLLGAAAFLIGALSGTAALFARGLPWPIRRLGLVGAAMVPVTTLAFLVSPMVMDLYSARYLAAMVLMSPFALAPAAAWLGTRRFGAALAPYALSAAAGGWLSFTPLVDGLVIRTDSGRALDERGVADVLRRRGIRYAVADYWVSYRLTFLYREDPIVVPNNASEDRYPPYREAFERESDVAYVFDPLRSRERLEALEESIRAGHEPYEAAYERAEVGRFTLLFLHRRTAAPPVARAP